MDPLLKDEAQFGHTNAGKDSVECYTSNDSLGYNGLESTGCSILDSSKRGRDFLFPNMGARWHSLCHLAVWKDSERGFGKAVNIRRSTSLCSLCQTNKSPKRSPIVEKRGPVQRVAEATAGQKRFEPVDEEGAKSRELSAKTRSSERLRRNRIHVLQGKEWYLINHRSIQMEGKDWLCSGEETLDTLKRRLDICQALVEYSSVLLALGSRDKFPISVSVYKDALAKKRNFLTYGEIYRSSVLGSSLELTVPPRDPSDSSEPCVENKLILSCHDLLKKCSKYTSDELDMMDDDRETRKNLRLCCEQDFDERTNAMSGNANNTSVESGKESEMSFVDFRKKVLDKIHSVCENVVLKTFKERVLNADLKNAADKVPEVKVDHVVKETDRSKNQRRFESRNRNERVGRKRRSRSRQRGSGDRERDRSVDARNGDGSSTKQARRQRESIGARYSKFHEQVCHEYKDRDGRSKGASVSYRDSDKHFCLHHKRRAEVISSSKSSKDDASRNESHKRNKSRRLPQRSDHGLNSRPSRSNDSLSRSGSASTSLTPSNRYNKLYPACKPSKRFKGDVPSNRDSVSPRRSFKRHTESDKKKRSSCTCCSRGKPTKQRSGSLLQDETTSANLRRPRCSVETSGPNPSTPLQDLGVKFTASNQTTNKDTISLQDIFQIFSTSEPSVVNNSHKAVSDSHAKNETIAFDNMKRGLIAVSDAFKTHGFGDKMERQDTFDVQRDDATEDTSKTKQINSTARLNSYVRHSSAHKHFVEVPSCYNTDVDKLISAVKEKEAGLKQVQKEARDHPENAECSFRTPCRIELLHDHQTRAQSAPLISEQAPGTHASIYANIPAYTLDKCVSDDPRRRFSSSPPQHIDRSREKYETPAMEADLEGCPLSLNRESATNMVEKCHGDKVIDRGCCPMVVLSNSNVSATESMRYPSVKVDFELGPPQTWSEFNPPKDELVERRLPNLSYQTICSLLTKAQTIHALTEFCNVPRPVSPLPPEEILFQGIQTSPKSTTGQSLQDKAVLSPCTHKETSSGLSGGALDSGTDIVCEITVVQLQPTGPLAYVKPTSHVTNSNDDPCKHHYDHANSPRESRCPLTLQKLCFIILAKNVLAPKPLILCKASCKSEQNDEVMKRNDPPGEMSSSPGALYVRPTHKRTFAESCSDEESYKVFKCSKEAGIVISQHKASAEVTIANVNNSNDSDDELDTGHCHHPTCPPEAWGRFVCDDISTPIVLSASDRVYHVSGSTRSTDWAPLRCSGVPGFTNTSFDTQKSRSLWSNDFANQDCDSSLLTTQAPYSQLIDTDFIPPNFVQQKDEQLVNSDELIGTSDLLAQAMESAGLSESVITSFLQSDFTLKSYLSKEVVQACDEDEADEFLDCIFRSFDHNFSEVLPPSKEDSQKQVTEVIDFTTEFGAFDQRNDTQSFNENNQYSSWPVIPYDGSYKDYAPCVNLTPNSAWHQDWQHNENMKPFLSMTQEIFSKVDLTYSKDNFSDLTPMSYLNDNSVLGLSDDLEFPDALLNDDHYSYQKDLWDYHLTEYSTTSEHSPVSHSIVNGLFLQGALTSPSTEHTDNHQTSPQRKESTRDKRNARKRRKKGTSVSLNTTEASATDSLPKKLKLCESECESFVKAIAVYTGNKVIIEHESCTSEESLESIKNEKHSFVARTLDYVRRWGKKEEAPSGANYRAKLCSLNDNASKILSNNNYGVIKTDVNQDIHSNDSNREKGVAISVSNPQRKTTTRRTIRPGTAGRVSEDKRQTNGPEDCDALSFKQETTATAEISREVENDSLDALKETISPFTLTSYFNQQQQTRSLFTQQLARLSPGFLKKSKKNSEPILETSVNRICTKIFRASRGMNRKLSSARGNRFLESNKSQTPTALDYNNNASWDRVEPGGSKLRSTKNNKTQDSKKSMENEGRLQLPRVGDTSSSLEKERKKLEKATDKFRKHHQSLHQAPRTLSLLQQSGLSPTNADSTNYQTPTDIGQLPEICNARSGNENHNKSPIDTVCSLPAMRSASARESSKVLKFVKRLDTQYGDQLAHGDVDTKQRLNKFCKSYLTKHGGNKKNSRTSSMEKKSRDNTLGCVPAQASDKIDEDINFLAAHNSSAIEPGSIRMPETSERISSSEAVPVSATEEINKSTQITNCSSSTSSVQSKNTSSIRKSIEVKAKPSLQRKLRPDIASSVNRLASKPPSPTTKLMYKIQTFEREFKKPFSIGDNIKQTKLANSSSGSSSATNVLASRDKCVKDAKKLLPLIAGGRADSGPGLEANKAKSLLGAMPKEPQPARNGLKTIKHQPKELGVSSKLLIEFPDEKIKNDKLETRQSIMASLPSTFKFSVGETRPPQDKDVGLAEELCERPTSKVNENGQHLGSEESPSVEIKSLAQLKRMTDRSFAVDFPDFFEHGRCSNSNSAPIEKVNDAFNSKRLGEFTLGNCDVSSLNSQKNLMSAVHTTVFNVNAKEKAREDERNKSSTVTSPASGSKTNYYSVALPDGLPESFMREPVEVPESNPTKSETVVRLEEQFQQFLDECGDEERDLLAAEDDYLSEFDDIDVEEAEMYLFENPSSNDQTQFTSEDIKDSSTPLSPSKIQKEYGTQPGESAGKGKDLIEQGGGDCSEVKSTSAHPSLSDDSDSDYSVFKVESLTSIKNSVDKVLGDSFNDIAGASVDLFSNRNEGSFWGDNTNPWSSPASYVPGHRAFKKLTPIQEVQEDEEDERILTKDEP